MHQLSITILATMLAVSMACSLGSNFPKSVGVETTMHEASVVLVGHPISQDKQTQDVTFEVDCILKSGSAGIKIGSTITIDGEYSFNTCTTTYLTMNDKYMIALENKNGKGTYKVYEPNVGSPAAYLMSQVDIDDLMEVCSIGQFSVPTGKDITKDCPSLRPGPKVLSCRIPKPSNPSNSVGKVEAMLATVLGSILIVFMATK